MLLTRNLKNLINEYAKNPELISAIKASKNEVLKYKEWLQKAGLKQPI